MPTAFAAPSTSSREARTAACSPIFSAKCSNSGGLPGLNIAQCIPDHYGQLQV